MQERMQRAPRGNLCGAVRKRSERLTAPMQQRSKSMIWLSATARTGFPLEPHPLLLRCPAPIDALARIMDRRPLRQRILAVSATGGARKRCHGSRVSDPWESFWLPALQQIECYSPVFVAGVGRCAQRNEISGNAVADLPAGSSGCVADMSIMLGMHPISAFWFLFGKTKRNGPRSLSAEKKTL